MILRKTLALLFACYASTAFAANDVYGNVSEVVARSGDDSDNSVYIRLHIIEENSEIEACMLDANSIAWELDLTSPVAQYQYDILQKSYTEQLPVRIIGYDNVCDNGETNIDKIYELSPWAWDELTPAKVRTDSISI